MSDAEDRLKRSLANAVQLEMVDSGIGRAIERGGGGMSIERGPNGRLENLERILSEVKRELLIGADPDYFTDHGQMENAVIAIRKMLSAEAT